MDWSKAVPETARVEKWSAGEVGTSAASFDSPVFSAKSDNADPGKVFVIVPGYEHGMSWEDASKFANKIQEACKEALNMKILCQNKQSEPAEYPCPSCASCAVETEGVILSEAGQNERMTIQLELDGGNIYRPHQMMVAWGRFWRCAHGSTGWAFGGEWVGCPDCAKDDPEAYRNFSLHNDLS